MPPTGEGRRAFSVARFLIALVLLIGTEPFVQDLPGGRFIESTLYCLVMFSAVFAVGARPRTLVLAAILMAPAVIFRFADLARASIAPHNLTLAAALVFMAFVVGHLFYFIVCAPRVDSEVLCAGVAVYLLMGVTWSFAYMLVARLVPGSFAFPIRPEPQRILAGFDAIYFSFTTMSTGGYGDIVPVSSVARLLSVFEQIAGLFYFAILISRLVSAYASPRGSGATDA